MSLLFIGIGIGIGFGRRRVDDGSVYVAATYVDAGYVN